MTNRQTYEEPRVSFLELAFGVELKVEAWVQGWYDPGVLAADPNDSREPEGDEEMKITSVELHCFGKVVDLTDLYTIKADEDLELAVEEAMDLF